jgi:hypothetical protein
VELVVVREMSSLSDYAFTGEWNEAVQNKLKMWCAKYKDFLAEMNFEEALFEEFITV